MQPTKSLTFSPGDLRVAMIPSCSQSELPIVGDGKFFFCVRMAKPQKSSIRQELDLGLKNMGTADFWCKYC